MIRGEADGGISQGREEGLDECGGRIQTVVNRLSRSDSEPGSTKHKRGTKIVSGAIRPLPTSQVVSPSLRVRVVWVK